MNKDRVEGAAKDIAGRVERQAGEWTGNTEAQVKGTLKQAEGKAQNVVGKAKDAVKDAADEAEARRKERQMDDTAEIEKDEELERRRKAS